MRHAWTGIFLESLYHEASGVEYEVHAIKE